MGRYVEESMDYTPEEWAEMRSLVKRLREGQAAAAKPTCARCNGTREIRYKDPRGYTVVDECKMCATDERLRDAAEAVVRATRQALGGDWIITGDGEKLIGDLADALQ